VVNVEGLQMRLKITHALSGSIDGIQLSHFVVGQTYDVGSSLGSFLLAIGSAEPETDEHEDRDAALVGARRLSDNTGRS
jgi:hypothetical protein